jgi:enoyl-CoA hydratase/carnithine racemase
MSAVRVEVRPDRVALLTIDQPGSRANVLSAQLWTELEAAVAPLGGRTDLAGLVIASGKPGMFIAGADLKFFQSLPGPFADETEALVGQGLRVLAAIGSLPFPTAAAIDGAALGGGLEVALACDYRLVGTHPRVELGLPETKLGLIPGWGGTQRLPRVIGLKWAAEMLATGASVSGPRAAELRLTEEPVASEELVEHACRFVAGRPRPEWAERRRAKQEAIPETDRREYQPPIPAEPVAVREALTAMTAGVAEPLADGLAAETAGFLRVAGSDESKRLIEEFFASRKK